MTAQAFPSVMSIGVLFGTSLLTSRFSLTQLPALTFVELRLIIASLCFAILIGFRPGRRWPHDPVLWRRAAILGIMGTAISMTCMIASLEYQSSGVSGLLLTTSPAFSILLAHFFLPDESLTRRKGIGIVLAFGGAALLAISGETGLPEITRANPIGYLLVFMSIMAGGTTNVFTRKYMLDYDVVEVSGIRTLAATLAIVPLALLVDGFDLHAVDGPGYVALAYSSLAGPFFGGLLLVFSIQRFGVTATAMVDYIVPIVALVGGALFLGEMITPVMILGMVLIVVGITLIRQRGIRKVNAARQAVRSIQTSGKNL